MASPRPGVNSSADVEEEEDGEWVTGYVRSAQLCNVRHAGPNYINAVTAATTILSLTHTHTLSHSLSQSHRQEDEHPGL